MSPLLHDPLPGTPALAVDGLTHAYGARVALDATGRFLLAATDQGRVMWCTPQAERLLGALAHSGDGAEAKELAEGLIRLRRNPDPATPAFTLEVGQGDERHRLEFTYLSPGKAGEYLYRLSEPATGQDEAILKQAFALTAREADVLLWIARGKANRDIGQILGLSPRTVNKHLEQIYAKLGVENRTAAAALALRTLEGG